MWILFYAILSRVDLRYKWFNTFIPKVNLIKYQDKDIEMQKQTNT